MAKIDLQAESGQVWVCTACGKRSKNKSGTLAINRGWYESCILNAVLCYEDKLVFDDNKRYVVQVNNDGIVKES